MTEQKQKFIWFAGITPTEREKLKELTQLYKGIYNNPTLTFADVVEKLVERIDVLNEYNLKNAIEGKHFSTLKLYIEKEEFYDKLIDLSNQKLRDKSNLIRWLINVAYEIEFGN